MDRPALLPHNNKVTQLQEIIAIFFQKMLEKFENIFTTFKKVNAKKSSDATTFYMTF